MSLLGISRQTILAYDTGVAIIRDASERAQLIHNDALNDVKTEQIDADNVQLIASFGRLSSEISSYKF